MGGRSLAAVAGLLALGSALGACGPQVPPHLERIEYLERHLGSRMVDVESNFFTKAIFAYDDGRGNAEDASPETRIGTIYVMLVRSNGEKPLDYYLLSVRDTELHGNDGDVDKVVLYRINEEGGEDWNCELWRYEIPDEGLLKRLDKHYERSTRAAYLALTEGDGGEKSYSTSVGEGEWHKLSTLCGH